jgi:hypothetical protein
MLERWQALPVPRVAFVAKCGAELFGGGRGRKRGGSTLPPRSPLRLVALGSALKNKNTSSPFFGVMAVHALAAAVHQ